jgi:sulfur-carrier protein adenylyltransferase/sulfurtransferase
MPTYNEITVQDLKNKMDANEEFTLVDVREAHEKVFSDLGGILIPLSKFELEYIRLNEKKETEIVLYCRSGGRSGQAANYLISKGFTKVTNVLGGINKWATEIDPKVPTY